MVLKSYTDHIRVFLVSHVLLPYDSWALFLFAEYMLSDLCDDRS